MGSASPDKASCREPVLFLGLGSGEAGLQAEGHQGLQLFPGASRALAGRGRAMPISLILRGSSLGTVPQKGQGCFSVLPSWGGAAEGLVPPIPPGSRGPRIGTVQVPFSAESDRPRLTVSSSSHSVPKVHINTAGLRGGARTHPAL